MLDGSEVDDKIVAVHGEGRRLRRRPGHRRICRTSWSTACKHYFLTYKQAPTEAAPACELTRVYGREEAFEVIRRSQEDYLARFGEALGPLLAKG